MRVTSRWTTRFAVGTLVAVLLASVGFAQVRWDGYRRNRMPPRFRSAGHRDNGFTFCRLMYTSNRRESAGRGWRTDYPAADVNFMIRLSELTSTNVDFDDRHRPNHWVVEITDPELFSCPFVLTSDVGTMGLNDEEVGRLRTYLVKGGFLWWTISGAPRPGTSGRPRSAACYRRTSIPSSTSRSTTRCFGRSTPFCKCHRSPIPLLAKHRRVIDLGTRPRQRRGALPGDPRQEWPDHGRHDLQHRHSGRLGA